MNNYFVFPKYIVVSVEISYSEQIEKILHQSYLFSQEEMVYWKA